MNEPGSKMPSDEAAIRSPAGAAAYRSSVRGDPDGYRSVDASTYSRSASYLQRPAKTPGPLAHRAQPEVAGELASRIEAYAVIRDVEGYVFGGTLHAYANFARPGVFEDVVQHLPRYTVDVLLDLQRDIRFVTEVGLDLYLVPCPQGCRLLLQRGDEPFLFQRLGPQLEDERLHLGSPRLCQG